MGLLEARMLFKEKPLKGLNSIYIKPEIYGGAAMAGVYLANTIHRLGGQIQIFTGKIEPGVRSVLDQNIFVNLDHNIIFNPSINGGITKLINNWSNMFKELKASKSKIILYFPFSKFLPIALSKLVKEMSYDMDLIIPMYDPPDTDTPDQIKEFVALSNRTLVLPGTTSLERHLYKINPNVKYETIPPFFDDYLDDNVKNQKEIKKNLGIEGDLIIFVQPTRIDDKKGIEKAVQLAFEAQKKITRQTILLITGKAFTSRAQLVKNRLEEMSKKLGIKIYFLNTAPNPHEIMSIADLVTFFSEEEGFGMPPAEASYLKKPVIISPYKNQLGDEIFYEIYRDFEFILDKADFGKINQETIDRVCEYIYNRKSWEGKLNSNREKAKRYSATGLAEKVVKILT